MEEKREMAFYDDTELALKSKAVTIRLSRGEGDKYNDFHPGDEIEMKFKRWRGKTTVDGVILAHWIMPLSEIPAGLICGEAYEVDGSTSVEVESGLRWKLREDLSLYYREAVESDSNFHAIVCLPKSRLLNWSDFVQLEGEDPIAWIERCGEEVLGHIDAYRQLDMVEI